MTQGKKAREGVRPGEGGEEKERECNDREKRIWGLLLFFFLGLIFCTEKLKEPLSFFFFLTFHQTPILLVIYRIFNFSI